MNDDHISQLSADRMMRRPKHIWPDADIAKLRRMYAAGRSDDEIGTALGVSATAVRDRRSKLRLVKAVHVGKDTRSGW